MDDILKQGLELMGKAKDYGEKLGGMSDTLGGMFAKLFNGLTLGLEVLDNYKSIWSGIKLTNAAEIQRAKEQNEERVILIQKMIFIESMSIIESSLKKYIAENPGKIGDIKGKVYLIKILNSCKDKDLLSESDYGRWDGLRELRNAIIHNNAISDVDLEHDYNNMGLELKRGEYIQGNLFLFPTIIDWILDQVGDLALKLHTA